MRSCLQAMMAAGWGAEHLKAMSGQLARGHARWAATRAALRPGDLASWGAGAASAEPLRAAARYNTPAYSVIENPGEPTWADGSTAEQIADAAAKRAIREARWLLGANAQGALKKLLQIGRAHV